MKFPLCCSWYHASVFLNKCSSACGRWDNIRWHSALPYPCFPFSPDRFYDHSDIYGKQSTKDEAYWTRSCWGHGSELIGCLRAQGLQILSQTCQPSQNTALCSRSSLLVSLYVLHWRIKHMAAISELDLNDLFSSIRSNINPISSIKTLLRWGDSRGTSSVTLKGRH